MSYRITYNGVVYPSYSSLYSLLAKDCCKAVCLTEFTRRVRKGVDPIDAILSRRCNNTQDGYATEEAIEPADNSGATIDDEGSTPEIVDYADEMFRVEGHPVTVKHTGYLGSVETRRGGLMLKFALAMNAAETDPIEYGGAKFPSWYALYLYSWVLADPDHAVPFRKFTERVARGVDPLCAVSHVVGRARGRSIVHGGVTYRNARALYRALAPTVEDAVSEREFERRIQNGYAPDEAVRPQASLVYNGVYYSSTLELYKVLSADCTDPVSYDAFRARVLRGVDPKSAVLRAE